MHYYSFAENASACFHNTVLYITARCVRTYVRTCEQHRNRKYETGEIYPVHNAKSKVKIILDMFLFCRLNKSRTAQ